MNVGHYVQHYLAPGLGRTITKDPNIPYGSYAEGRPQADELLQFLNANWLPSLPAAYREWLSYTLDDSGFRFSYDASPSFSQDINLDLATGLDEFGVTLDGQATLTVAVTAGINFDLAINTNDN